jgi:hypothetical protein
VKLSYEWDLAEPKEDFKRESSSIPNPRPRTTGSAITTWQPGDLEKAMAEMKRALELEPLSPSINNGLGGASITCANIPRPSSNSNMH